MILSSHDSVDPVSPFGFPLSGFLSTFLLILLAVSTTSAQNNPHIGYVYPAGGKQGAKFDVVIGGQFLAGATNACVSGAGVQAAVINYTRPLTPKEANDLREKLQKLQEKRGAGNRSTNGVWTTADQAMLFDIRQKLASFQRRPANPAIAETVTLEITLATNAITGQREIRLRTPVGLSNPLTFCVGQLPEFSKKEAKADDNGPRFRPARNNNEPKAVPATETSITLPAVVNGRVLQGGVDRFRFSGRKGQRLVIIASARDLIPYLPDAVPGWFQASVALYDGKGRELAYADHFRFRPDPVLSCVLPADGQYLVQIRDSIYRGREDFVYRLSLGDLPFVTRIFPLGGPAGATNTIELTGWNLPASQIRLINFEPGIHFISVTNEQRVSNLVPFAVDTLPEYLEQEPNDSPDAAQRITLPIVVNGRINKPGDRDIFRFQAHEGEEVVAEVLARRLNSPVDSVLRLTDASGNVLAFNDDYSDKGEGLETHHADSWLHARIPADGTYHVHLSDAQHDGGPEFAYRLRVSAPRPDFELRVVPASLSLRSGGSVPLTVYAIRKDGFTNAIDLALSGSASGFKLSGARLPSGQDSIRLTLSAPFLAPSAPVGLALEGHASIQGQTVTRPAVPAEDMMQAFAYHHLVPAQELKVVVTGRGGSPKILDDTPVKIPAGGTARVRIAAPFHGVGNRFQLDLSDPPDGISLEKTASRGDEAELVLNCDAKKVKPGLKGNLIVEMVMQQGGGKRPAQGANQRRSPGTLPAIPFEIVEP
jgi:hypothetical protein